MLNEFLAGCAIILAQNLASARHYVPPL